jgi:hypothetical protein
MQESKGAADGAETKKCFIHLLLAGRAAAAAAKLAD